MMTVEEIMTSDPVTLDMNATIDQASDLMRNNRIRHVPVVGKGNKLIGLLTQRDLLAAAAGSRSVCKVAEVMKSKVLTVTENTELRSAAIEMQKAKIGCLPVVRGEQLVAIITDSDYVGLAINLLEQIEAMEPPEFDDEQDNFDDSIYLEDEDEF